MDNLSRPITREELGIMLEKYKIGKKPLSKLLGWGETTVLLYSEADSIPDNEFTRRLYYLYSNVPEYLKLLEDKHGVLTPVAYRKSKAAVVDLFKPTKILCCAEYVRRRLMNSSEGELSLLRMQAILFWSQVVSLCIYGKPLFTEDYQPSRSGMPYRTVEERVKTFGCIFPEGMNYESMSDVPDLSKGLVQEEEQILGVVTDMFSWYGYEAILRLMEAERYRLCGPKGARKRRIVSVDMLRRCYAEVFTQAKVTRLKDVEGYIQKRINFIKKTKKTCDFESV